MARAIDRDVVCGHIEARTRGILITDKRYVIRYISTECTICGIGTETRHIECECPSWIREDGTGGALFSICDDIINRGGMPFISEDVTDRGVGEACECDVRSRIDGGRCSKMGGVERDHIQPDIHIPWEGEIPWCAQVSQEPPRGAVCPVDQSIVILIYELLSIGVGRPIIDWTSNALDIIVAERIVVWTCIDVDAVSISRFNSDVIPLDCILIWDPSHSTDNDSVCYRARSMDGVILDNTAIISCRDTDGISTTICCGDCVIYDNVAICIIVDVDAIEIACSFCGDDAISDVVIIASLSECHPLCLRDNNISNELVIVISRIVQIEPHCITIDHIPFDDVIRAVACGVESTTRCSVHCAVLHAR